MRRQLSPAHQLDNARSRVHTLRLAVAGKERQQATATEQAKAILARVLPKLKQQLAQAEADVARLEPLARDRVFGPSDSASFPPRRDPMTAAELDGLAIPDFLRRCPT